MKKKGIDVDQLMEEVNRAVAAPDTLIGELWREQAIAAPNLSFLYPPYSKSLMVNLDLVSRNWEVDHDFPIGTRRKLTGAPAIIFKRMTRGSVRWYINPIVHQIRKFNMLVTRTLHDLANNLDELSDRVRKVEEEDLQSRIEELESRIERLERGGE